MANGFFPSLIQKPTNALWRRWMLACALVAMLLKAALPMGYMLAQTGPQNAITIVLCTASGNQNMVMTDDGSLVSAEDAAAGLDQDPQPASKSSDHPCTFAGQSAMGQTAIAPILTDVTFDARLDLVAARAIDQVPGQGLAAPPPPATASPILI